MPAGRRLDEAPEPTAAARTTGTSTSPTELADCRPGRAVDGFLIRPTSLPRRSRWFVDEVRAAPAARPHAPGTTLRDRFGLAAGRAATR